MINIRLAEINFCIENRYNYIEEMCNDYLTDGVPDVIISVTEEHIDAEGTEAQYDKGYLESLAIYRQIAEKIIDYNGFLMHGVVLDVQGMGIAFLAKSGVGKSTHTELWQEVLGERMTVINGDKPLIRIVDGKIRAYGTPWAGKEKIQTNTSTLLNKICFIERSKDNSCIEIAKEEVLEKLFSQIYKPKNGLGFAKTIELIEKVIEKCKFYTIRCNREIQAAQVAIDALLESDIEKNLRENKVYITKTQGDSMAPMLKTGDRVVIVPVTGSLKLYDVPVYRRGDHFTMHRIMKITSSGYVICGDNRTYIERDIKDSDIVGVLSGFYKDGKYVDAKSSEFINHGKKAKKSFWIRKIKRMFR
ncbi:MAG: hypothetical protein IJC10_01350 [Clostridia bacterium]|nr:hypothetical protein [Clostridia bacterium]